jgi:long-chain acyl-CoA synthetase
METSNTMMLTQPTGTPLGELAEAAVARFGDRSVLVFEGTELTQSEIAARARRLAGGLLGLGVQPGDRVAVCMANCPEVLEAYQAIWRIGAAVTPLLFLLSEDEIRYAVAHAGAKAIITTPEFLPKVTAAAGPDVVRVVVGEASDGALAFDDLLTSEEAPLASVDSTDMAALLFTGGTTGRSKGVVISHDALSAAAWSAVEGQGDDGFDVSLVPLPIAHVFGLMVCSMTLHAIRPTRAILMRWFEPNAWLGLVESERVQAGPVVPMMLRILASMPLDEYDLSSLRRLTSGSAPLPAEVHDAWARMVPHVEVVEGYGCSETTAIATSSRTGFIRRGSVGRAVTGVTIRIERPDGTEAVTGEDGEICVSSPTLMTGYWNDPAATAAAIRDGWFHTGDIGHLDADGFLYIVDRIKDVIIRGGFNVYPRDVEEVLMRHPAVAACGVIGRPDDAHGEEVVAFVQLAPGAQADQDEIRAYAKEHLSAVKYPREIHVLDAIPVTSVGKLDRKALRARL